MHLRLSEHFTYKKLLRFAAPSVIMMVISSIYGIVDGYFVSNFVGKNEFAALNFIMPAIMILGGIGFIIGTGGAALVSKTRGEGNEQKANEIFTMLVVAATVGGALLSTLGFFLIRPIARLIGATPAILEDCVTYARWLFIGNTAFILQNVFSSFFVVAERPKMGLVISVSSGVTNMLLDFLLVGVLKGGLVGAAIATNVGQLIGGIIPIVYFASKKNKSPLRFRRFRFMPRALFQTLTNGLSEFVTNISVSIVGMVYNAQLLRYAGEDGVAAYGVLMYVGFIFLGLFFGYSLGVSPVISFHYGAGNKKELRGLLQKSLILTACAGAAMTALSILSAYPLSLIFVSYDEHLLGMTVRAMRFYGCCFLFFGFNVFASSFFTALNNGAVSAFISILRTFAAQIAAVLLLPLILGVDGIWLAVTASEIATLFFTVPLLIWGKKKYGYGRDAENAALSDDAGP